MDDISEKTNKNTARILIVDDQISTLQGMARLMSRAGYEVFEASSGSECLRLAAQEKFDLILLDVVLPDIDGLEVCSRIKSDPQTNDVPVVLISSVNVEADNQAEGLELGADGYIARPIANRELLARVKAILRLKLAESRLRESEELFRAMFQDHKAVMLLIEPVEGKIIDANHAAEQFYGYSNSQLCSMRIGEINTLPPEEMEAVRSLAISGERSQFVFPHRLANGEIRTVEVYSTPIRQNRKTVLFSIIHDITDRKMAEEALLQSEDKFSKAFFSSPDAISISRLDDGVYVSVNEAFKQVKGYDREEVIGKTSLDLRVWVNPLDRQKLIEALKTEGKVDSFEASFRTKTGDIRYGLISASIILLNGVEHILNITRDITERKRAEEVLLEKETRYRMVAEFTYNWEYWVNSEGNFLYVSPSCERITGYSAEEFISDPLLMDRIIHPDDRTRILEHHEHVRKLLPHEVDAMDFRIIRRDGEIRWIGHTCQPVYDHLGRPLGIRGGNRDITERKNAEAEVRQSEERFRNFLNGTDDLVFIKDQDYRYLFLNKALQSFYKLSDDEILGKTDFELMPEKTARQCLHSDQQAIFQNDPVAFEEQQGERTFHVRKFPVSLRNNKVGVGGFIHDITERKRVEESQRLLSTAIEQAAEGIIITDSEGTIQYVNPAQEILSGYSRKELIGQSPNVFKSDFHEGDLYQKLWKTINSGKVWSGRFINKRKDGAAYYEDATISPVFDNTGSLSHFVIVKHDVSKNVKLYEQFLQAQKMEAVGTLAGGIAHDFNNILQAVLGYCELMLQRSFEDQADYDYLKNIHKAGKRGADMVKKLLTLSRKSETKYAPVNLNQEVTVARDLLYRTIPKSITIDLRLKEDLKSILSDPSQIGQILMNLGVNARDAMPDGGTLLIETAGVKLDDEYCNIHPEAKSGNYALLTVSDTGHGMDKETLSHIFEPFFTTKEQGKGTGLGLATVYGIVRQHGGHTTCYSESGSGTTFKIYFPTIEDERGVRNSTTDLPIRGGTETILMVDDEVSVRDLGKRLLERFGYNVVTAPDGKNAVEIYCCHGQSIALVVMDLNMPLMDGRQCLTEILRIDPKAKVVMASGYSDSGFDEKFRSEGAKGFIPKPFDMRQLLDKVREVLDQL